ncbi:MAG: hypothetical protein A4E47_01512 [Methanosaeta sp. PtaU1.Bin028]|nr:MAG: hypothetical protein A4E47_01512 [Methanosaeta sp. PtaU1.Bin028]
MARPEARSPISVVLLYLALALSVNAADSAEVLAVDLSDAITPASVELIRQSIESAGETNASVLLLLLDTPGGGLTETLEIVSLLERSEVLAVGYVSPSGAKAWSAGTLILMSCDIAAMAPGTIIGSAQPVRLTPTGSTEPVNDSKTNNAIIALIEEKARLHGRNVTAARQFVQSNLNLNAETALEQGVIELVAESQEDLLRQLDGRTAGNRTLSTAGAEISQFQPDIRLQVLQVLADPMIAGLLVLIGLYALIFGLSNPGHGAEVFGVIALALGLIGQGFDVNLGALFLIVLGMGLILAELHAHSLGLLGLAGIICIIAGTALFAPVSFPQWYLPANYQRSVMGMFLVPSVLLAGFFAWSVFKVAQARLRPPFQDQVASTAIAMQRLNPRGFVLFQGEYWEAESEGLVEKGESVAVLERKDRMLKVRRIG